MSRRRTSGTSRLSLGAQGSLPSFASFHRENSSRNIWANAWKSQISFYQTSAASLFKVRGRHGGVERKGGGTFTKDNPPRKGLGTSLVQYVFQPPRVSVLCFLPAQESTTQQTRRSFGGVQKFSGGCVLWYVFLPPYVLRPQ